MPVKATWAKNVENAKLQTSQQSQSPPIVPQTTPHIVPHIAPHIAPQTAPQTTPPIRPYQCPPNMGPIRPPFMPIGPPMKTRMSRPTIPQGINVIALVPGFEVAERWGAPIDVPVFVPGVNMWFKQDQMAMREEPGIPSPL